MVQHQEMCLRIALATSVNVISVISCIQFWFFVILVFFFNPNSSHAPAQRAATTYAYITSSLAFDQCLISASQRFVRKIKHPTGCPSKYPNTCKRQNKHANFRSLKRVSSSTLPLLSSASGISLGRSKSMSVVQRND